MSLHEISSGRNAKMQVQHGKFGEVMQPVPKLARGLCGAALPWVD